MSEEPTKKGNGGEWKMPDPIFRSSEGRTPKPAQIYIDPDDVDTEAPNSGEYFADEIDTEIPNSDPIIPEKINPEIPNQAEIGDDTLEPSSPAEAEAVGNEYQEMPANTVRPANTKPKAKGGCAASFLTLVSIAAIIVLTLAAALIYFLYYYRPADNVTF